MAENRDVILNSKVYGSFQFLSAQYGGAILLERTNYDILYEGDNDHMCRHYPLSSGCTLIFQLAIVLLVISLAVFCFLRFKHCQSSTKMRGTIDHELEELVINHQTFATNDIDPHNTDHEKEKSQTATTSKTDKQIEAKLPDVINSRD